MTGRTLLRYVVLPVVVTLALLLGLVLLMREPPSPATPQLPQAEIGPR